jgi:hypothetical protein
MPKRSCDCADPNVELVSTEQRGGPNGCYRIDYYHRGR